MTAPGQSALALLEMRRSFGRRKVCKQAAIIGEDRLRLECTVVDQSEAGAGLRVSDMSAVPEMFNLWIECEDWVVLCRVAHRTNGIVGVRYLRAPRRASRIGTPGARRAEQVVKAVLAPHRNKR